MAGLAASYSSAAGAAVPLAQRVFTAEFGMGSGVWPLAMATRPSKAARDLASFASGWSGAAPDTDPGPSPAGLVGGKRVVWCLLEEGMPPLEWAPAFAGALARPTAPRTDPGSPGLAVLAAGRRWEADRAISTGQLRGLPRFHLRPIDVMVSHGSQARPGFEEGFPLRCFQRLSRPHLATRRCGWRHNRYTRGASLPVLSY